MGVTQDWRKTRATELAKTIYNTHLEIQKLAHSGLATDGFHTNRLRNLEFQLELVNNSLDRHRCLGPDCNGRIDKVINSQGIDILVLCLTLCLVVALLVILCLLGSNKEL